MTTVDPCYPQVHGSKETAMEEQTRMLKIQEFSALKLLKFTYTAHIVVLSIYNLKLNGVVYIAVTKINYCSQVW
jgi:hypothetical protein